MLTEAQAKHYSGTGNTLRKSWPHYIPSSFKSQQENSIKIEFFGFLSMLIEKIQHEAR